MSAMIEIIPLGKKIVIRTYARGVRNPVSTINPWFEQSYIYEKTGFLCVSPSYMILIFPKSEKFEQVIFLILKKDEILVTSVLWC